MENNSTSIPKWITIYLWITALITAGFCFAGYFMPDAILSTWEALSAGGALSLAGPLGLFLSRNVATLVVTIFGLINKNVAMIKIILILRLVSDGFDAINNFIGDNLPVAIFGAVMCLIEIFALTKLNKH